MGEFGGSAGSGCGEIRSFEEDGFQATELRVQGATGAGSAASNDAEVEGMGCDLLQGFGAAFHESIGSDSKALRANSR